MVEQQTAAAPTAESSAPASLPSLLELIESVATEQATAEPAAAATGAAPTPGKPPPAGFVDPLDEANFTAEKLATPEGIQAARELLQAQVKEALNLRRAAHNARAEAERREAKFKATKESVLSDKKLTSSERAALGRDLQELQSGDPEKFIQAIGRLANARDPHDFWTKTAIALAKGKPVEDARAAVDSELKREVEALKAERQAEKDAAVQAQHEQAVLNLRIAAIDEAATYTDLPYVHSLVNERDEKGGYPQVALIDARLTDIKTKHYNRTGQPIDTRAACGILENEIRSHFELLQRAGNPSGALSGEKGAAAPVAGLAGKPELTAKPESAPRSPIQSTAVTAVPSALTAAPAATKRVLNEAEAREAKIAELDRLGLFSNFGM